MKNALRSSFILLPLLLLVSCQFTEKMAPNSPPIAPEPQTGPGLPPLEDSEPIALDPSRTPREALSDSDLFLRVRYCGQGEIGNMVLRVGANYDSTIKANVVVTSDESCELPIVHIAAEGMRDSSGRVNITRLEATPTVSIADLNENAACGITNWEVFDAADLLGTPCEAAIIDAVESMGVPLLPDTSTLASMFLEGLF